MISEFALTDLRHNIERFVNLRKEHEMATLNFPSFRYFPVLGAAEVERTAYGRLRASTREGILPIFELTRHRGSHDFQESIDILAQSVQLPFLIDLDKRAAPPPYESANPSNPAVERERVLRETAENNAFNAYLNSLLTPTDGFLNWRSLVSQFPNAVPVLQYTNPSAQVNQIIRQASLLSQDGNSICMRVTQAQSDVLCQIAMQIIAILPTSNQLLIVFDCGQGRRGAPEKAAWVVDCIQLIRAGTEVEQMAGISAVCMSNSYPQLSHNGIRIVESFDREIWAEASDAYPFSFGDYAASHRLSSLSAFLPRTYRATVVHPHADRWVTHRHENSDDPTGWREGATAIVTSGHFDPIASWTDQKIQAVADHGLGEMDNPRPWHAARISGHIERQFEYTPTIYEED